MPGKDWVYSLLARHKNEIRQKRRANVSRETTEEYFQNLRETLKDVPTCNMFNYDKTNLLILQEENALRQSLSHTSCIRPKSYGSSG